MYLWKYWCKQFWKADASTGFEVPSCALSYRWHHLPLIQHRQQTHPVGASATCFPTACCRLVWGLAEVASEFGDDDCYLELTTYPHTTVDGYIFGSTFVLQELGDCQPGEVLSSPPNGARSTALPRHPVANQFAKHRHWEPEPHWPLPAWARMPVFASWLPGCRLMWPVFHGGFSCLLRPELLWSGRCSRSLALSCVCSLPQVWWGVSVALLDFTDKTLWPHFY